MPAASEHPQHVLDLRGLGKEAAFAERAQRPLVAGLLGEHGGALLLGGVERGRQPLHQGRASVSGTISSTPSSAARRGSAASASRTAVASRCAASACSAAVRAASAPRCAAAARRRRPGGPGGGR